MQNALHAKAKAEAGYLSTPCTTRSAATTSWLMPMPSAQQGRAGCGWSGLRGHRRVWGATVARELALALREKGYRRLPSERVLIPKATALRPLGISTSRSGLHDGSDAGAGPTSNRPSTRTYAYVPGATLNRRWSWGTLLDHGHPEVVDADLASYFGSIPHAELLISVARRIVDRRVLHLIKMWLDCPVEETDDRGRKTRTTEARDNRRGIPQGSPISPLLANLYMRRFVLGWKKLVPSKASALGS